MSRVRGVFSVVAPDLLDTFLLYSCGALASAMATGIPLTGDDISAIGEGCASSRRPRRDGEVVVRVVEVNERPDVALSSWSRGGRHRPPSASPGGRGRPRQGCQVCGQLRQHAQRPTMPGLRRRSWASQLAHEKGDHRPRTVEGGRNGLPADPGGRARSWGSGPPLTPPLL